MTVPAVKDVPERRASHLKLYEATDALAIVHGFLEETEGELTPEIEDLLAQAEGDFDTKAERVALFVRERLADAVAIKVEIDRLRQRAGVAERIADSLKEYLKRELVAAGTEKQPRIVKRPLVTVRVQKNSQPAVRSTLTTESLHGLYAEGSPFATCRIEYALDRSAVVDRWRKGEAIPDGVSVEEGSHVRIA